MAWFSKWGKRNERSPSFAQISHQVRIAHPNCLKTAAPPGPDSESVLARETLTRYTCTSWESRRAEAPSDEKLELSFILSSPNGQHHIRRSIECQSLSVNRLLQSHEKRARTPPRM